MQELFEGGYNDICILSLSLGATRTFEARQQHDSARCSCETGIQDVAIIALQKQCRDSSGQLAHHATRYSEIFQAEGLRVVGKSKPILRF